MRIIVPIDITFPPARQSASVCSALAKKRTGTEKVPF
jgi:hypothetical protein